MISALIFLLQVLAALDGTLRGVPETIVFPSRNAQTLFPNQVGVANPPFLALQLSSKHSKEESDYGSLTVGSSRKDSLEMNPEVDYYRHEMYRHQLLEAMNASQPVLMEKYWHNDELAGTKRHCYRNNWSRSVRPVCNSFHEIHMELPYTQQGASTNIHQENNMLLRANGSFFHVWLLLRPHFHNEIVAFKSFRYKNLFPIDAVDFYDAQRDAIIMERLTSSDRIMNIYGYCGITSITEAAATELVDEVMPMGGFISKEELAKLETEDVVPLNNLTLIEKLDVAILMAESLAELHGHEGGVIAHGDVYPSQWLRTPGGKIKLNDFNTAELLDWDPWNQRYCTVERCHQNWNRAPEDLTCGKWPANEGIDTYCMGNNIYTLLTGLWVFYWSAQDNEHAVMMMVLFGQRTYVNPRYRTSSLVERKLVELMEETWVQNIDERISIFDILRRLREIKELYIQELRQSSVS